MRDPSGWFQLFAPNPKASIRLFCFPYAGAGASIFRTWPALLPEQVEVCGVQYPGRETRAREACLPRLAQITEGLLPALLPLLDRPFAFFGHSMGAFVSFDVTHALRARSGHKPEHLFFSGAGAPHLPEPRPVHDLPDAEFLQELVRLNGVPKPVLQDAELLEYMLPILRADFRACETYRHEVSAPLPAPISVFGGEHDPRVDRRRLEAWSDHASVYFSLSLFRGDHFFLRTAQSMVLSALARELAPVIGAASVA